MKVKESNSKNQKRLGAFTLIEMIGVLAVIAILAAVLIPKVFEAINNSRINNASMSCDTVKTSIADHYTKAGTLNVDASGATPVVLTLPYDHFDNVLLREQFLDKPFAVKIGDGTTNTLVRAKDISTYTLGLAVDAGDSTGFALAGGATNTSVGSVVIEAIISGVTEPDAKALNDRIDGISLGVPLSSPAPGDVNGRVKYALPVTNGTTTVYVYLTHR